MSLLDSGVNTRSPGVSTEKRLFVLCEPLDQDSFM